MTLDTGPTAARLRLAAVRRMEPAARLHEALELSDWARRLALAGLKERHPDRGHLELVEILVGQRLVPAAPARPRP